MADRTPANPYDTVPLRLYENKNIRLLEIVRDPSASDSSLVTCNLHVTKPEAVPPYVALSYMWGEDTIMYDIILNGQLFKVRQNLYDFLRTTSLEPELEGRVQYFWIDALCINQRMVSERNHQVAMMGKIYSEASKVLIWLGVGSIDMACFIEALARPDYDHLPPRTHLAMADGGIELLNHNYWTRAWIVQECILAVHLELRCGLTNISAPAERIPKWYYSSNWRGAFEQPNHRRFSIAKEIIARRRNWHKSRGRAYLDPWDPILERSGCSDTRDKIYAMISLMNPGYGIIPDYNKSKEDLFNEIADRSIVFDLNIARNGNVRRMANILELGQGLLIVREKEKKAYDKLMSMMKLRGAVMPPYPWNP
jgi:hypothetical protein